ncbi:MAG TPA: LysE family transporter [Alphaproteobacteria bacterium]
MTSSVVHGLLLNLALLMAIGPQSLFLVREGLAGKKVYAVSLLFLVSDMLLFSAGLMGVGRELAARPLLAGAAMWVSVAFLFFYGWLAAGSAWSRRGGEPMHRPVLAMAGARGALAVTFLNPWVYLDTLLLIPGASAALTPEERLAFGTGAILGSVLWFLGLAALSRKLGRLLSAGPVLMAFDCASTLIVWGTAAMLATDQLSGRMA